ncbi:MAG: EamA family transporter [Anaerolineae bacterium]
MNLLLLLALGTIWGSSYLFIKVTVADVPPLTLVAGRLTLAAVILWGVMAASRQSMPRRRSLWGAYTVMGFFSGTLPYVLISWGEQYISSGLAALLQATMPIFTVLMAHFAIREERLTMASVLGVAVGFAGVAVLMLPDLRQGLHASLWGQAAIVVSSASYAGAAVYARLRLRGQSPLASTTGQLTMGAVLTLPLALIVDRPFHLSPSPQAWWAWLGLILLGTVIAYIIYYAIIERTSATFVSMVTYVIPVNGLLLGALVLNETLTLNVLVSAILILAGVVLVRR